MGWLRLDDRFDEHRKVVAAGYEAAWLHIRALLFCARNETDGFVPDVNLPRIASDFAKPKARRLVEQLVTLRLWDLADDGSGWWIHDYLDFNPSANDLAERRSQRVAAGRKGGKQSGKSRRSESEADASSKPKHAGQTPDPAPPASPPSPPQSGGADASPPKTNPRANGTNPRAVAEKRRQAHLAQPQVVQLADGSELIAHADGRQEMS